MSAFLAFLGTYLLSLFVALLAALQLGDYFAAGDELGLVLIALSVFVTVCLTAFVAVNATARQAGSFNVAASALALLSFTPLALPILARTAPENLANPFAASLGNATVALEFVVPALIAVLIQWGLMRRQWLLSRGEDSLSLWPWIATMIGGLAILNPLGLDIIGQAIAYRPANWLRDVVNVMALSGAGALLVLVMLETYIRGRMLRRRAQSV